VSIEMAYLTFIQYWKNGYAGRTDGYEYVLMWGMLPFAIALRGGRGDHRRSDRRSGAGVRARRCGPPT